MDTNEVQKSVGQGKVLGARPKSDPAGQSWRTRPKAPGARQTNAGVKARTIGYATELRRRITTRTGFSAAFLEVQ